MISLGGGIFLEDLELACGFFFEGLEFSILELGLFGLGVMESWGACWLLRGPVVGFRLLTAAGY